MGAGSWQIFRLVRFPAALPYIFAGLKIAATYSIMGAVIGEWLMAQRGLGLFMIRSYHSFLTAQLFAAIVVVTVLSILLFGFIEVLARNLMPWHYAISESPVWEEKGGE
jgi:ABC-type nitrate/sulfonate/bicarbonate transport system permease component